MPHKSKKYILGIDEAGRGPLAGPVVVAGVKIESRIKNLESRILKGIKDSKKLSAKQREKWFGVLTNHPKIEWAVAKVYPETIDRINIARAANLGARRVCSRLSLGHPRLSLEQVLLDGGLRLPKQISHQIIIRGDEKVPIISAASIIAKVTRDRIMARLHKKYPQYGFDVHKGYGTKFHCEMIRRLGKSDVHRNSFSCKNC